jgi:hypothetical protein
MLQLLIKDGPARGLPCYWPLDSCRLLGGERRAVNIQPGRSPMQLSPSMLDNIHPMHSDYILRREDSFAIRPTSNSTLLRLS